MSLSGFSEKYSGNSYNFEVRIINPSQYKTQIYDVYKDSLKGYPPNTVALSFDEFFKMFEEGFCDDSCRFFGAFSRETGELCGYSDVYVHGSFLPISSLHTRVTCEKSNVNFALIYGILEWFSPLASQGCYLCEGAKNSLHHTNFQDFLICYFGFRKAYCKLHIVYRPGINLLVNILFPFRKLFYKFQVFNNLNGILRNEAWKRGKSS